VAIPVFASIPVDAKAIVEGSLEAFRLNVASTSVLDLKLGNTNRFGFHQEGSNVWVDGVMKVSGSAELSATVKLKMGVGNPNIGDLHVSAGFGPRARWSSGACGVNLDLGSFSAGARIWKLKVGTPSWSPFSINLWKDCRAEDGSSGGASSGGGSGGGAPSGGAPGGTFTAIAAGRTTLAESGPTPPPCAGGLMRTARQIRRLVRSARSAPVPSIPARSGRTAPPCAGGWTLTASRLRPAGHSRRSVLVATTPVRCVPAVQQCAGGRTSPASPRPRRVPLPRSEPGVHILAASGPMVQSFAGATRLATRRAVLSVGSAPAPLTHVG
jgi:hypothetical protein